MSCLKQQLATEPPTAYPAAMNRRVSFRWAWIVAVALVVPFARTGWTQAVGADDAGSPRNIHSALLLQAAVCEVIGIGQISSQTPSNTVIQVTDFWLGDPGSNLLTVSSTPDDFVGCTTPFLFFLSRYQSFLDLTPPESHFSYIFDMNYHRSRHEPDGLYLYDGVRSWIPVTPENANLVTWSSNLVQAAQVAMDPQAFYELIRDGYRLNADTSRIHRDSVYTFMFFHYFNEADFMQQVWADPLLVGRARAWVNMSYQQETKTWLP